MSGTPYGVERMGADVGTQEPAADARANSVNQREFARWVLAEAALLGCFADVALRTPSLGAGFTLWIVALVATLLMLAKRGRARLGREHHAWLVAALLCSWMFAWRDTEILQFTNLMATLVALMLFAMCIARAPRGSILDTQLRDLPVAWLRCAKQALG